ncbi:MAG TPA: response regulator [Chloroflexia bacterium]|nr:response regulator [Chloroflexia bacterium]
MPITEESYTSTYNESAGNILVVDDRRDIIHIIQLALEQQPVQVFSAGDGHEALKELEQRPYDLVLLDAKMPGINGFEVCRIIKNSEKWRTTKVIMISASTISDDKLRAFDAGADDYVTKPFRIQELKARIQVMLNLRKAERELTQRNEQLLELIRVSESLNRRLDLHDTAREIVRSATRMSHADRAFLWLWENEKHQHYLVSAENPHSSLLNVEKVFAEEDEGITGEVRRSGRSFVIPNYKVYVRRVALLEQGSYETAGFPLRVGDRHVGVLVVTQASPDRHFFSGDLDILTTLANQASIAIENARLYTDLTRESEKYRLIADKASDLIISLDTEGNLTYVNERVLSILGYDPAEMLERPLDRYLAPEGQLALKRIMRDLLRPHPEIVSGGYYSDPQELVAVNRDGALVFLEFNFGLLYRPGSSDQTAGIQAIGRDVTSRKRSEENERMRMIGQIASGVAHDLNNVLANVLGHAQLLRTETEDPEVLNTIKIIEQSALDGAETVRRIQEFTVQRMQQNLDLVNFNEVVQSTIDLSRPRWRDDAQRKGMKIEVERDLQPIPQVRGKAAELREVLMNLFNNAMDALPPQGGKIGFRTYLENHGRTVCLEVWDTGRGMPADVRRHIFEPFYTTKGVRGTGLGLSVAYGIITRFGGEITVESIPEAGTTFYIRLPAADDKKGRNAPGAIKAALPKEPSEKSKGRILAIDDEVNLRTVIRRALSLGGFEVDVAGGGPEALEMLRTASELPGRTARPYDLIFTDLGMPDMSGWEVAQEVRHKWPEVPIVLVTGWGEQVDQERLSEHNIKRTVAKPFNIQDLMELAGSLITPDNTEQ